ncbi:MAG: NAD(P)-binding protein, partial [Rubrivivax sp.]
MSQVSEGALPRRERIAILGGGIASLTTAFELTSQPGWSERYDITLYQMGWRLGGKCATARGPNDRIEEHGIHGFLGCYYNALPMMVELYKALDRKPGQPLATFEEAFHPDSFMLMWEYMGGSWKQWPFTAPTNPLTPDKPDSLPTLTHWMQSVVQLLNGLFESERDTLFPQGSDRLHLGRSLLTGLEKALVLAVEHGGALALEALDRLWLFVREHTEHLVEGNDRLR